MNTSGNFASETLYKETLSKNQQVPAGKTSRFKWGKTTSDVTSRRDIPFSAKVLMDAFSEHGKGAEVVALSQVFLSEAIGGNRGTVAIALAALESARLIEKCGQPSGHDQIQAYRMLHPALLRSSASGLAVKSSHLRQCPRCHKPGVLRRTGWCLACTKDVDLDARVGRKVTQAMAERGIA